jgi:hypothetical protein
MECGSEALNMCASPNLHQVLLGKWPNSNAPHLPCPGRVSLLAISLQALPATLLNRGNVEILARQLPLGSRSITEKSTGRPSNHA